LVLITSAVHDDNPEIIEARRRGIRVERRYDFFPQLTAGKKTIAIAGTHGKTTTTGMIGMILTNAGFDPDAIVGGIVPEWNSNARAGNGEYFVIEADEYDRAFLGLRPHIAVVTSIELDHPDIYRDVNEVVHAFQQFLAQVPDDGLMIGWGDAARIVALLRRAVATVRYGLEAGNDWRATDLEPNDRGGTDFVVWRGDARVGEFELTIPGSHNVLNALAAMVVAHHVGVPGSVVRDTLEEFSRHRTTI